MVPYEKYEELENSFKVVHDRFDPKSKTIMSEEEKAVVDQKKADEEKAEMMAKPKFEVSGRMIDDWTGSRFADNVYSNGVEKFPPKADPTFLPAKDPDAKEPDYTPEKTPEEENKAQEEKVVGKKEADCCDKKEEKKEEKDGDAKEGGKGKKLLDKLKDKAGKLSEVKKPAP